MNIGRAVIRYSEESLLEKLDIPEGLVITGIEFDSTRSMIHISLAGNLDENLDPRREEVSCIQLMSVSEGFETPIQSVIMWGEVQSNA